MVNRGACGDIKAVALCALKRRQGAGCCDLIGVVARACHLKERDVTIKAHALGHGRDGGQATKRCELARGDGGTCGEDRLLGVCYDERTEGAGVCQRALEDFGVGHDGVAIGKAYSACIHQEADLCHFAALAPLCERGEGEDIDGAVFIGAAFDKLQRFGCVDRGGGIRADGHCCDPTSGRCAGGGSIAFFVALAWFADFDADVDNPRGEAEAIAINCFVCLGWLALTCCGDCAVLHKEPACVLGLGLGVDELGVGEEGFHISSLRSAQRRGSLG